MRIKSLFKKRNFSRQREFEFREQPHPLAVPLLRQKPTFGLRLLGFIALALALMYFDAHHNRWAHALRSQLTTFVAPLQFAVNFPRDVFSRASTDVANHKKLLQDNAKLRSKNLLLQAKVQRLLTLEKENKKLLALLSASSTLDHRVLVAQLLAVRSTPFRQQVVLDAGSDAQVTVGQPVLDAKGVMGQIIDVNPKTSQLLLITDRQSAVPVEILRNEVRGIIVGNGDAGTLSLIRLPKTTDIKVGDQLVTSGLGQRYPEGYPVGQVTDIVKMPEAPFLKVTVKPAANINRSRQVLLVQSAKKTPGEQDA